MQYRESFCATVVETYEGGTGASVSGPECESELTAQRTNDLKKWLGDWFRKVEH